jgi:hypothetical protein
VHSNRPRHRYVQAVSATRVPTAAIVDPPLKEAAVVPAHQPGSSFPPWVLLLAVPALAATCLGAANELGLIRRRA